MSQATITEPLLLGDTVLNKVATEEQSGTNWAWVGSILQVKCLYYPKESAFLSSLTEHTAWMY